MKIDRDHAKSILFQEAARTSGHIDRVWEKYFLDFSILCETSPKTHIAFLGTAILAKCVSPEIDPFSVKAGDGLDGKYSARSLCHNVLVPNATEISVDLGVTGKEPLNNQPYFRIDRVSSEMPIHRNARLVVENLMSLLNLIDQIKDPEEAKKILRAFISVRRKYGAEFIEKPFAPSQITQQKFIIELDNFVKTDSEGGKRAQAVVAGVIDSSSIAEEIVTVGKINDPSRKFPGDIIIRDPAGNCVLTFEVRDKPVSREDLFLFARKALESKAPAAAVIAVASDQLQIQVDECIAWADERGLRFKVFLGWESLINSALFWARGDKDIALIEQVLSNIYERLQLLEVSPACLEEWLDRFNIALSED